MPVAAVAIAVVATVAAAAIVVVFEVDHVEEGGASMFVAAEEAAGYDQDAEAVVAAKIVGNAPEVAGLPIAVAFAWLPHADAFVQQLAAQPFSFGVLRAVSADAMQLVVPRIFVAVLQPVAAQPFCADALPLPYGVCALPRQPSFELPPQLVFCARLRQLYDEPLPLLVFYFPPPVDVVGLLPLPQLAFFYFHLAVEVQVVQNKCLSFELLLQQLLVRPVPYQQY